MIVRLSGSALSADLFQLAKQRKAYQADEADIQNQLDCLQERKQVTSPGAKDNFAHIAVTSDWKADTVNSAELKSLSVRRPEVADHISAHHFAQLVSSDKGDAVRGVSGSRETSTSRGGRDTHMPNKR